MHLETLCEELGLTRSELAELVDAKQPWLAKFEDQSDFLLSMLRRYVEALGGQLEVTAVFDGARVRLGFV